MVPVGSKAVSRCGDSMDLKDSAGLRHCEVKNMYDKEPGISVNGDVVLDSAYITNGYTPKAADEGSSSESGYTTPKKRRAKRGGMKDPENESRERSVKSYFKQDVETTGQGVSEKVGNPPPDCTRTCLFTEVPTGVRRTNLQDSSVGDTQSRNSDCKASGPVSKKSEDRASKAKLTSSVGVKEDSWTLFKPPPVFPVDNSSAKIVPKISYASKVKENLKKGTTQASPEETRPSVKLSQVPMSAVKTVNSVSFASNLLPLDANGCPTVGSFFNSAASTAPSACSKLRDEDVIASSMDDTCCSLTCSEPRKPSCFVYPHKPLNMQPPAAQTNQKAIGDIFRNQWGLSFINEPNVGPAGTVASHPATRLKASDITFQGMSVPFNSQSGLDLISTAVSLPAPIQVQNSFKPLSSFHTAGEDCAQFQPVDTDEQDKEPTDNRLSGATKAQNLMKDQDDLEWVDLKVAVFYHTKEFEFLLALQKQDPNRVVYYAEAADGPDH